MLHLFLVYFVLRSVSPSHCYLWFLCVFSCCFVFALLVFHVSIFCGVVGAVLCDVLSLFLRRLVFLVSVFYFYFKRCVVYFPFFVLFSVIVSCMLVRFSRGWAFAIGRIPPDGFVGMGVV